MKKSALKIAVTSLLSVVLICSFLLSAGASGYNAYSARKNIASGNEIVDIQNYQSEDDVSKIIYGIKDASGLVEFAKLVNTVEAFRVQEVRVCLCASIDMSDIEAFTPIGNGMSKFTATKVPSASFGGTFDGCGYVIDNLTTASCSNTTTKVSYASLFGSIKDGACIQNLVTEAWPLSW